MAANQAITTQHVPSRQVVLDISYLWAVFARESKNAQYIVHLERLLNKAGETNQRTQIAHNELLKRYNQLDEHHKQLAEQHEHLQETHAESLATRGEIIDKLSDALEAQKLADATIKMLEEEVRMCQRAAYMHDNDMGDENV
ncbi:hypothetical protein D8B26_005369 [Coccidioides posadasii str. Silveira]|uniref:Uncharacterized protein n=1 Tax=Coccidioides posadasii (strain RMSCC 757 / Silveira) TaxID=443226 RepID=E9D538_COCPS|nr:conserved hypothetical protein [Coccidioides posadasii str. Silveira]QVM10716.1 hypothetical protein D8B26_005369 [Coccidioides posadasii str. Silveira]